MEGEAVTYLIVEGRLAPRFRRALRHYEEESGIVVVMERRAQDRRRGEDRRMRPLAVPEDIDRRGVRNREGLRIAERRATLLPVHSPLPLPRRLRAHEPTIAFAERVTPGPEHEEDIEAARLVVRIQAGDATLFGRLYKCYFDRVFNFMSTLVEDQAAAERLTQDTFLDLHDSVPGYQVLPTGFREQLARIMRARAAEHLHGAHGIDVDGYPSDDEPAPGATAADDSLRFPDWVTDTDLQLLIRGLPLAQRQTVMLRYLLGLTEGEAARVCGSMPEAVLELTDGALGYLRERLATLGREMAAPSLRLPMLRGRRPARVLQSRRLALLSG